MALASSLGLQLMSCGDDEPKLEFDGELTIDLTDPDYEPLLEESGWILHPDVNVLIINVNQEIRAFTSVCPHSQCVREWDYSPGVITCTCHNSKFDSTGQYLSGPANANLREFSVNQEGVIIKIG